jgi:hypothetical protein
VGKVARDYEAIGTNEGSACCADATLAIGGKRDVRDTGVTAIERPFGLAVTDDEYSGSRHGGRREGCVEQIAKERERQLVHRDEY